MPNNLTVLYYSSNREDEYFENKIMENILKQKGDLPLVSVTQKPRNLGHNVCVGIHDNCYNNEFKQIQIGLQEVQTEYVLVAEADCLYPPEYFAYNPKDKICFRYNNVWIYYSNRDVFNYKGRSDGAQIVNTKAWLELITKNLENKPEWFNSNNERIGRCQFKEAITYPDKTATPVISFKTINGVNNRTQIREDTATELPYWGTIEKVRKEMLNG